MERMIEVVRKREQGFSIVELMIALSLLGIVLALGYMFFSFGLNAFNRGERQAIAQQAARISADYITSEIRFASEIEINPSNGTSESGYSYIFEENNNLIYQNKNGDRKTLADSQLDSVNYSIFFTSNVPYDVVYFYMIADKPPSVIIDDYIDINVDNDTYEFNEIELDEALKESLYFLKTKVQALNLELFKSYSLAEELIILNGNGGSVIKYKIPD